MEQPSPPTAPPIPLPAIKAAFSRRAPMRELAMTILDLVEKGFTVYVDAKLYAKLKDVFEALGIEAVPTSNIAIDNTIVFEAAKLNIVIKLFVNGELVAERTVPRASFIQALQELAAEKRRARHSNGERPLFFKLTIPAGGDGDDERPP